MTADLTPGRALDERVARLLAWSSGAAHDAMVNPLPYSRDMLAALLLLDTLAERGWGWSIDYNGPGWYLCELRPLTPRPDFDHVDRAGPTLPLAVCAAVLAALDGEDQ